MANEAKDSSRILEQGTRVEICPFRRGFSHHYLAHMDGRKGTVKRTEGFGDDTLVFVKLDGGEAASIAFPLKAIRPIPKDS